MKKDIKDLYLKSKTNIKTKFNGKQADSIFRHRDKFLYFIYETNKNRSSIAMNSLDVNCAYDKYDSSIKKTYEKLDITDYKKGLYGSSWYGFIQNYIVSFYPMKSIKNLKKTNEGQSYMILSGDDGNEKITLDVNTYEAKDMVLIRAFAKENKSNILCYDAIFDKKNPRENELTFYYTKNKYLFEKK